MQCPCSNIVKKIVPPEGSKTPKIYIAGMAPGEEEFRDSRPFIGPSGQVLRSALRDAGYNLETDVRFFNVVACRTTVPYSNKNRDPTQEEIDNCKELIFSDIEKTQPGIILVMGKAAAQAFTTKKYTSVAALMKETSYHHKGIPIRFGYHPSYLLRNGGTYSHLYPDYVNWFKNFSTETVKKTLSSLTIMNSDEFLVWEPKTKHLGFDIEATSLNTIEQNFFICGIGFADVEGNGFYLYLKDEEDFLKVADRLKEIILNYTLYVFNFSYEGTAFANKLQIHPYQWNMVDARQTAMVVGKKGGLKEISHNMSFIDWEIENTKVVSLLDGLYKAVFNKKGGKEKALSLRLRHSWEAFKGYCTIPVEKTEEIQNTLFTLPPITETKKKVKVETNESTIEQKCTELEQFYNHPDSVITTEKLREVFLTSSNRKEERKFFDLVPINIIARYCAHDAYAAIKIHSDLWATINDSEKKAFGYLNEHAELGAAIHCTGVGWDIEQARYLDKYYQSELIKALKNIINNDLFKQYSSLTTKEIIDINSLVDIKEIQKEFNPNSTQGKTKEIFNKIMNQSFGKRVWALWSLYQEISLTPEDNFTIIKDKFIYLLRDNKDIEIMKSVRAEKREFIKSGDDEIKSIINLYKDQTGFKGEKFLALLDNFSIESMNEAILVELYNAFTQIGGIDIDDRDTWELEFKALYDFRLFKKIYKANSTYLWGRMGMGDDARLIDVKNKKLISPPRLKTDWEKYIKNGDSVEDFAAIVSWSYNVNGAETNRWQGRYHTWPPGSELQDLKVSRYPNGLLAHVDYSQMEVRTVAALAGDKGLLEAYKQGKDIHRFMASQIFNKKEENVTGDERRYSKMLTFAVIYGETEYGIARDYFSGDIKKAKKLVGDFYKGVPDIARYIQNQHELIEKNIPYVRSVFGEKIFLKYVEKEEQKEIDKQLKKYAVNTPVQSSASHIAGLGINRVNKEAFERCLPINVFGFTHDAGDFDFVVKYLFEFFDILHRRMELDIDSEFNIPVKIDIEMGVSGDKMLEFKIDSKSKYELHTHVEGTQEALTKFRNLLNVAKISHTCKITDEKEEFMSNQQLFMKKRAFSERLGTSRKIVEASLSIFS